MTGRHRLRPPVAASAKWLTDDQLAHVRLNISGDVLGVVTSHGGQVVVAGPDMDAMVSQLTDVVVAWALDDRLADVLRLAPAGGVP